MKTLLKILASIILVLVMAEIGLRIVEKMTPATYIGNESGKGYKAKVITMFLQEKINKLWARSPVERNTILEPPFQVFINKNFQNKERMDFIFKHAALPPNMHVTAENFLRLNKSAHNQTYTATTNSLSFRGIERTVAKPKKTFRIVLLGSYPAFGHGANDDETYAHIIEQNFKNAGKKVEVWNGGRQGGTSIMGYARLMREVENYKPDLVLWDYGWIELYLGQDRVRGNPKFEEIRKDSELKKMFFRFCLRTPVVSSLKLCSMSVKKLTKVSYTDALDGWKESMNLVREWSVSHKVPVMFLRHRGVTIPKDEYEAFHSPEKNFLFVDTSPSLNNPPTTAEIDDFWSRENWLSEVGFTREEVMKNEPDMVFFGDGIQYNKLGYSRIGNFLHEQIMLKFPDLAPAIKR
jgi:hypothetical protein